MTGYRMVSERPVYFVTFTVVDWLPVFVNEQACTIIVDSLNYCHREKHLRVNAFVIMPTHLHTILFDADFDVERLRDTLAALRKYTGRQLAGYCAAHMPKCFLHTLQKAAGSDRQRRFWQGGTHPEAVYTQDFWRQKVDYIHANPLRNGLVQAAHHWRFSSAAWWLEGGHSDVILTGSLW